MLMERRSGNGRASTRGMAAARDRPFARIAATNSAAAATPALFKFRCEETGLLRER
jgi:hypothetical protein